MTYDLLTLTHIIAAILIGGGLIGVWLTDLRSRQSHELVRFSESVNRLYFMRLRRLTQDALRVGVFTPELEKARAENVPTFTHFLDFPMLFLIVALGALKPNNWGLFIVGSLVAVALAAALTILIPRLYPWAENQ